MSLYAFFASLLLNQSWLVRREAHLYPLLGGELSPHHPASSPSHRTLTTTFSTDKTHSLRLFPITHFTNPHRQIYQDKLAIPEPNRHNPIAP
jgi:hypothetical protein